MSIPITNRHEYAHDSFIATKKQIYSDEKYIDTKYEYTDSLGKRVIIQNSLPRGGLQYTDPDGKVYVYAIFFLKEGMDIIVSFESEEPIMAQMPNNVELEITYSEPAVKGDTSSGALKTAVTENGVEIKVPLFVK